METYPLELALFDFVPVTIFLVGAFFLVQLAMLCRSRPTGRMAMAGALLVFLGGFLKAFWKLMYTTRSGDFRWMSEVQFALVAPGFFALLITAIFMARGQGAKHTTATLMTMAGWKVPLLILMTLSSLGAQGILAYVAFRRRVYPAAAGFIIAFLGLLAMGGMASGEQTVARQWIEESINTLAQTGFALGTFWLYRHFRFTQKECAG